MILSAGHVQSNKNVFCSQNRIKLEVFTKLQTGVQGVFKAPEYLIRDQGDHPAQIQNFSNFPEKKYMLFSFWSLLPKNSFL